MKKLLLIALLGMFLCVQIGCQALPLSNLSNAFVGRRNHDADYASYEKPLPSREHIQSNPLARNNLVNYPLGYRRGSQPCRT